MIAWRCKQAGQLASKMRFLAAPWLGMLQGDVWLDHARHANTMAARLSVGLTSIDGIETAFPTQANGVFVRSLRDAVVPHRVLHVHPDLRHVDYAGTRIALGSRRPLRRVLRALLHARDRSPQVTLSTDDLARFGWPGESPRPDAARNRVYVALSALRAMGLAEVIERHDGGFRIQPDVRVSTDPAWDRALATGVAPCRPRKV